VKQLRILLSFDHELSLGGCDSYTRNIFEPTDLLLDLADQLQVPITLFTDICCAKRFREWDPDGFYRTYERQISSAVERGHDVQLHLHPHWIDSEYRNGRFIPAATYSLGGFRHRAWPNNISGIIAQGIELLEELCRADAGYQCVAYRAGGFSLSPDTDAILSALYEHGIRIESTVAKGFQFACDLWDVDFRNMPTKANWWIARSGPLNREAKSGLYEIPIAARPRTPLNNVPFLWNRVIRSPRRYHSGGWSIDTGKVSLSAKLKRLIPRSAWMLGFDQYAENVEDLLRTLNHHVAQHSEDDLIACSAISHPKFMGEYARTLMKAFVERVRSDYGDQARFCSYRQFYDEYLPKEASLDEKRAGHSSKSARTCNTAQHHRSA
jgi:hypothetical protein